MFKYQSETFASLNIIYIFRRCFEKGNENDLISQSQYFFLLKKEK